VGHFPDFLKKFAMVPVKGVTGLFADGPKVRAIDLLPHFRGDLASHGPGVLSRGREAAYYRVGILPVKNKEVGDRLGIGPGKSFPEFFVLPEARHDGQPILVQLLGELERNIQHQLEVDIEQSRHVLGTLDVTAHPKQTIGNTA
jgi:hypothetical protein